MNVTGRLTNLSQESEQHCLRVCVYRFRFTCQGHIFEKILTNIVQHDQNQLVRTFEVNFSGDSLTNNAKSVIIFSPSCSPKPDLLSSVEQK